VGVGHHLHPDGRGVAVSVYGPGSALAQGRGVVDEPQDKKRAGGAGVDDGSDGSQTTQGVDFSFRSGLPILQPYISQVDEPVRDAAEHEPQRGLLGQRAGGIVFQDAQRGVVWSPGVSKSSRGSDCDL